MFNSPQQKQEAGFTLVELMVTLAIVAIVAAVAIPGFDQTIVRNRVSTQTNEFLSAIAYARSEAVKRGQTVAVVAKVNDWANGYTIQLQSDGTLIHDYAALEGNATLTPQNGVLQFAFNSRGLLVGNTDTLDLCHGAKYIGRTISLTATGMNNVSENSLCP